MVQITFKDGNSKQYPDGSTGFDIASYISKSLAKEALAIKCNNELIDIYIPINHDCKIEIITPKTEEGLEIIRHDTAHLLAQAVQSIWQDVKVCTGPVIENGFYYDFYTEQVFTESDLEKIEAKMHEIAKQNLDVRRKVMLREKAVEKFEKMGEGFKAEIIREIPEGQEISLYEQGDFVDLCRGPHAPNTSFCKHFKLTKVSGSYWRGDAKGEKLQRIYGTAWAKKSELDQYLFLLEEAKKRDHRKLGPALDLFHISQEAVGSVFWHPKGEVLYTAVKDYINSVISDSGYQTVRTPILLNQELWEKSGHWDKYADNMFICESEKSLYAVKPMNCPAHIEIFKKGNKSYRDLPLRFAEFGCCHRNEPSGSLHGLMRVRGFVQDDAHIFCTPEQINSETAAFCDILKQVYHKFGFDDIEVRLATRPEQRVGDDETWDKAEKALETAAKESNLPFIISEGDGAFYGPKLEFHLTDAVGRKWQCGTLQADFILAKRLDAFYTAADGSKQNPVILHRAIIGTLERFIGILIEHHAGAFPSWLAPVQVAICPLSEKFNNYAHKIEKSLKSAGFRCVLDLGDDKVGYKIRHHSGQKIPFILVLGKSEEETGTVNVRTFGSTETATMSVQEFIKAASVE